MKSLLSLIFLFCTFSLAAQDILMESYEFRRQAEESSLLKNYPARNIGPVVQGGRVTDIEVPPGQTEAYFVAFASGGIFKTEDNGVTFHPVFDNEDALGIGDMALAPSDPNIIFVGTGEKNSSRSSYAGSGVYRSEDGGKSWQHVGLEQTHHIGRVLIHPANPDIAWVASLGALYSHNEARGVYRTADGGATWTKTLYINDSTGIVDLVINPANPDELLAAAWERTRKSWNFKGDGPGSGIYRSVDGGKTWAEVKGFPQGDGIGRIGLAVSVSNPARYYALLDNQNIREEKEKEADNSLSFIKLNGMSTADFARIPDDELEDFLRKNNFPAKYTSETVKEAVASGTYSPTDISKYYGDANDALFNTDVIGAELYRSDDNGQNWEKVNSYDLDGVYFTYGYYFGEVRVAPDNEDLVYIFGVPLLKSTDGGVHYARIDTMEDVHVDHQALWINPENTKHLRLGNDGGLYESYDEGAHWRHLNNMPVGQFYTVNFDNESPYNVYGGLQDNGSLVGSSNSIPNRTRYWERLFGGDGMFVSPDPRNSKLVYVGFQFGNYFKINRSNGKRTRLQPRHDIGEDVPRYNWRTPLELSVHNPDIIYMASQRVYRSMNQGEDWKPVSPDLTRNTPQGNVPFSTITTLAESPHQFGKIMAGTDDGNVQLSSGGDWVLVNRGLPEGKWVSQVHASAHDENTWFVALNGYREDDFSTYLFRSVNDGKSWESIRGNLPDVVVNAVIQDPQVPSLIYVGTDHGLYISKDGGNTYMLASQVPNVAVYDLKVHPEARDLIIATHGRSIYVMDAEPLQETTSKPDELYLNGTTSLRHSDSWGEKRYEYLEIAEPELNYHYYVPADAQLTLRVKNDSGMIHERTRNVNAGFGTWKWNGKTNDGYIRKGSYTLELVQGEITKKKPDGDRKAVLDLEVK